VLDLINFRCGVETSRGAEGGGCVPSPQEKKFLIFEFKMVRLGAFWVLFLQSSYAFYTQLQIQFIKLTFFHTHQCLFYSPWLWGWRGEFLPTSFPSPFSSLPSPLEVGRLPFPSFYPSFAVLPLHSSPLEVGPLNWPAKWRRRSAASANRIIHDF